MKTFKVNDTKFSKLFSSYCNMENGPWIAGGSVRKVYEGKPWQAQDVDFFFKNKQQFDHFISCRNGFGKVKTEYVTPNAITYKIYIGQDKNPSIWNLDVLSEISNEQSDPENHLTIQLIKKNWHQSAWNLINDFDLGLCQFVTDGTTILTTNQAIEDAADGIIRPNRNRPQEITPQRLTKYCAYGYNPELGLLKNVLQTIMKTGYGNVDY